MSVRLFRDGRPSVIVALSLEEVETAWAFLIALTLGVGLPTTVLNVFRGCNGL